MPTVNKRDLRTIEDKYMTHEEQDLQDDVIDEETLALLRKYVSNIDDTNDRPSTLNT